MSNFRRPKHLTTHRMQDGVEKYAALCYNTIYNIM